MSQAWGAAASVVMGVVVGFLTNLITSKFTVPLAVGLGTTVIAWVVLTFVLQSNSTADTPTSATYGSHSPIINVPGNSGSISINTSQSDSNAPVEGGGEGGAR